MIQETRTEAFILWQENKEIGVGEPALLFDLYSDIINIQQDENSINLNYDSIDEFIKLLKQIKKKRL